MKRVILHVGPAKTGTTAIQGMLDRNRQALARAGVCYPTAAGENAAEGHPALAWEILEELGRVTVRLSSSRLTWRETLAQAEGAHTLLLSAEDFSLDEFDEPAIGRLVSLTGATELVVVYGLRDPSRLIPSIWQQAVRWGLGKGEELQEFAAAAPKLIERYRMSSTLYLGGRASALSRADLRPFIIPTAPSETLFLRFLKAASIDVEGMDVGHGSAPANEGIGYAQLRLLLSLNRIMPILTQPLDRDALIAREFVLGQLQEQSVGPDPIPLTPAVEEQMEGLRAHWRELVAGLDVTGDIAELAGPRPQQRSGAIPNDLAPELVLSRALVKLAHYARDVACHSAEIADARDWWRGQAEQMERARDWWQVQADDATRRLERMMPPDAVMAELSRAEAPDPLLIAAE